MRKKTQDLKGKKSYWSFSEEALDGCVWRTRFGKGSGSVVRLATE